MGCLGLAVELKKTGTFESKEALRQFVKEKFDYLVTSRPTAVNIQLAAEACNQLACQLKDDDTVDAPKALASLMDHLEATLANDVADNIAIGTPSFALILPSHHFAFVF